MYFWRLPELAFFNIGKATKTHQRKGARTRIRTHEHEHEHEKSEKEKKPVHSHENKKGIKIIAPAPYKKKIEKEKLDPDTKLPLLDENGQPIKEERYLVRMR